MKNTILKSKSPNPTLGSIFKEFYERILRRFEQKKVVYLSLNPASKTNRPIKKISVVNLTLETINHILIKS